MKFRIRKEKKKTATFHTFKNVSLKCKSSKFQYTTAIFIAFVPFRPLLLHSNTLRYRKELQAHNNKKKRKKEEEKLRKARCKMNDCVWLFFGNHNE